MSPIAIIRFLNSDNLAEMVQSSLAETCGHLGMIPHQPSPQKSRRRREVRIHPDF